MPSSRVLAAAVVAAIAAVGLVLGAPAPAPGAPGEDDTPIVNPDLPLGCGLDILVILDESTSIRNANATDDVRDAFKAFTRALQNTGSAMAVSEFSTVARLPLTGAAQREYTTVTNSTIATIFDPYINSQYNPDGSTHWEDGFRVGRFMLPRPTVARPHLTVFITDGDPNKIVRHDRVTYDPGNPNPSQNEYELKVPLSSDETSDAESNRAKDRAVPNANALKAQGSHILAVAVGNGLDSQSSLDRIIDVSGPDVFSGSGEFDITTDDVYRVEDFDDLEDAMRDAAFQLCAPSINIQKLVDITPDPGTDDALPADEWAITTVASPAPADWVLPPGATGNSATASTGADGFAQFQWSTETPTSSQITVTEAPPPDAIPGLVNDQAATACVFRTPDQPVDQNLPVQTTDGGFSATVPADSIVTCRLVNRVQPAPAVSIIKTTDGVDADTPEEAPFIPVGETVQWRYLVRNEGNVTLSGIEVTDEPDDPSDADVTVQCPPDEVPPGMAMVCTATGVARAGLYANVATVVAVDGFGTEVTDSNPSHYVGAITGIVIEKFTNGEDADNAPGPVVTVGSPITWNYVVRNAGTTTLENVTVVDSEGVVVTCPTDTLAPGETMNCEGGPAPAVEGQYENVGTASGTNELGQSVQDSDPSHYLGARPEITLEKFTNLNDADLPEDAPLVPVGGLVVWHYVMTNTGNVPLSWSIVDVPEQPIACPRLGILPVGTTIVCRAIGHAEEGLYSNTATATGVGPNEVTDTDSDPSHYFGVVAGIDLEKLTNSDDADRPPGPYITPGSPVAWTYRVTNTSNALLTDISVIDTEGVAVTCPVTTLEVDEFVDCTGTGIAEPDQYTNFATATGFPPVGPPVQDTDPSHYFGAVPGIDIQKSTNGDDADEAPGPFITVGQPVDWSYVVRNTGNTQVDDIVVTDSDPTVTVTCPATSLPPGEMMTCTATGSSVEGQYENVGSVTGTDTSGTELSADDPSHYFGAVSELTLVKLANGEDANEPPGVEVAEGADVTMTFLVTNSGNIPVKDVVVTDDKGLTPTFRGGDTNGNDELDPEEVWTYDAVAGPAEGSNLSNVGTVTGTDILERPLTASDPANVITAPVVPPPPPPAPPPDVVVTGTGVGSLPRTGTPLALSILVALVALATGALLLRRRNRRGELG